jgi:alpha-N-acetylglucosaminidase
LRDYCASRYGGYPEPMQQAWNLFRQSCYGWFTDHPAFGWQHGNCGYGSVNRDPRFLEGVQRFLACATAMGSSPLYRADALEQAAMVLGLKADTWFVLARQASDAGDPETCSRAANRGLQLLTDADRLLESHPLHRLDRWLQFARSHGQDDAQKRSYEANARRIVTVWGPPVNDYACRLWSGLIRDFYRERMAAYFESLKNGKQLNRAAWEEQWVRGSGVSRIEPFPNPIAAASNLVAAAVSEPLLKIRERAGEVIGSWHPGEVSTTWRTNEWRLTTEQLQKLKGIAFKYTGGNHRLDILWVAVIADGREIARETHFGYAGEPNSSNIYALTVPSPIQANNGCFIRAQVRSAGGTDSHGSVLLLSERP